MNSTTRPLWRYGLGIVGLAIVYFLVAKLSIAALGIEAKASPLWPAAGIALAVLVLYGQRFWVGIALGAFWVALSFQVPWPNALASCFSGALQAWVGAYLLQRFQFNPRLQTLLALLQFLFLAVVVTPIVNASYSSLLGYATGTVTPDRLLPEWLLIWLGDGMGILVMTPVLLIWLSAETWQQLQASWLQFRARGLPPFSTLALEVCLWLGFLMSISWMVFASRTGSAIANYPLEYLPFPFVVWAALRLGLQGTVLCSLLVSIVAVLGAVQNGGPFITKAQGNLEEAVLLMQAYIAVIGVTALVLATTVAERQASAVRLRHSQASLAKAQTIARLGNWDCTPGLTGNPDGKPAEPMERTWRWSDELYKILGYDRISVVPSSELLLQRVHPADREQVERALNAAIVTQQPYNLDYRLLLPDGSERIVNEQVNISQNRLGQNSITGTVQDITERKQTEAALREGEKMRTTMYRYMSQELAEQLIQSGSASLGGDRKLVSILFSDIRGYTTLTEALQPEETVDLLNSYFEAMVDVIFQHKGTLDKFIGDAIMAVFGSPIAQDDHAQRAILTALEMKQRLAAFNADRLVQNLPTIHIGIGINSDYVITGNIGSSKRMEFTAIGDGVNLSSRLEGATKYYGCDIIISGNTYQSCPDLVEVRALDYVRVKGKTQPIQIYELLGLKADPLSPDQQERLVQYHQGREQFQQRNFAAAIAHFQNLLTIVPNDRATLIHLERCQQCLQTPPPEDWDGSWQLLEK